MSEECDKCGNHCSECICNDNSTMQLAMSALHLAFTTFKNLGYELPEKIEFVRKKQK